MKEKKKILIISFICIFIILMVAIALYFLVFNKSKYNPEDVLNKYVGYINDKKYDDMYELLSNKSKSEISKEDFVNRNENIYSGIEAQDMSIEIKEISKPDNSDITILYDTKMNTVAGEISFPNNIVVSKENDKKYYIDWSSNLIYPELNNDDKLKINTIEAQRGSISDRNDVILAGKGSVSSIGFVPGKMSENKEADIEKVANLLEMSVDSINNKLNASYVKEDTFVALKNVSKDAQSLKDSLLQIPGIKINSVSSRVYSKGKETSGFIGYVQNINADELKEKEKNGYDANSLIGRVGLEKTYEDRLKGNSGVEIYITDNSQGKKKKDIIKKEVENGENIKLTIDIEMQTKIYNQMKDNQSSFVVLNSKTGEVLALVSTPSYDSNDFVLGMSNSKWNTLNNDEKKPMLNRYAQTWSPRFYF